MAQSTDPRLTLLHEDRSTYGGAFTPPVYRASNFAKPTLDDFFASDRDVPPNYIYSRVANPTTRALEEMVAALEHGDDALAFGSGMGAISATILAFLEHGDHVLHVATAYHPAQDFLMELTGRMQLTVESFPAGADIAPLLRPNTRLVYLESPTSHQFEMLDLRAISRAARAHGAITVIDNTWATPLYQQPLDLGIDVSLHSGTKYLNGHSDALCGLAITSHELMKKLRPIAIMLGATLSPEDAFLMIRGLRTLSVRMTQHMESGLAVARWLQNHPLIEEVRHPGLPESPYYDLWRAQTSGCSGLFGITLCAAPAGAVQAFVDSLTLFGIAVSWGGFESLVMPSDYPFQADQPAKLRLSIGLEPVEALIGDLEQALARYGEFVAQPAHA